MKPEDRLTDILSTVEFNKWDWRSLLFKVNIPEDCLLAVVVGSTARCHSPQCPNAHEFREFRDCIVDSCNPQPGATSIPTVLPKFEDACNKSCPDQPNFIVRVFATATCFARAVHLHQQHDHALMTFARKITMDWRFRIGGCENIVEWLVRTRCSGLPS